MTAAWIQAHASLIPTQSRYYQAWAGANPAGSPASWRGACVADPVFGFNFVGSFIETRQPFPQADDYPTLTRAYRWGQGEPDPVLDRAWWLEQPSAPPRAVLRALLMARDINGATIAERLSLGEAEVMDYSCLFFDVRERDLPAMRARLVYPAGRSAAEPADKATEWLRLGYEMGPEAVLLASGRLRQPQTRLTVDELRQPLLDELLSAVRSGQPIGRKFYAQLKALNALNLAPPPEDSGTPAMAPHHAVMATWCGLLKGTLTSQEIEACMAGLRNPAEPSQNQGV